MYCRMTTFKGDPEKRAAALEFIDQMKPKLQAMGATQMHWVECAPGDWTLIALYDSKAKADAVLAQANQNIKDAGAASVLNPSTVQRREGEIVRSI